MYRREWLPEQLLAVVRRYLRHADHSGERPTYLGYERFQRLHADLPSGTTVRNRLREVGLDSWPVIVTAAQRHALAA